MAVSFSAEQFRSDQWAALSDQDKQEQLQALENEMAANQGREARDVVISSEYSNGGCYQSDGEGGGTIYISENDFDSNGYECMDTVYHEGRHAYQDDVVHDRIENSETPETKQAWAHNDQRGDYITARDASEQGRYCDYYYQPQEADAYGFAQDKMDSCSEQFRDDPQYQEYVTNRDYTKAIAEENGKDTYGVDNEQAVKDSVRDRVEQRYADNHPEEAQGSGQSKDTAPAQAQSNSNDQSY